MKLKIVQRRQPFFEMGLQSTIMKSKIVQIKMSHKIPLQIIGWGTIILIKHNMARLFVFCQFTNSLYG